MRTHSINYAKEDREQARKNGKTTKYIPWFNRRWFFHFEEKTSYGWDREIDVQISTGPALSLKFKMDPSEYAVQFTFGFLFISIYLTFKSFWPRDWLPKGYEPWEVSMYVYDWCVNISIWMLAHSWSSTGSKRHWYFDLPDIFLGERKSSDRVIKNEVSYVAMPEKMYPVTVKLYEVILKRPRWFASSLIRADVECEEGIPFPGKGENSWDCGDDRTFSLSCPAKSVGEAVGKFYDYIKDKRERHGSGINMYGKSKFVVYPE